MAADYVTAQLSSIANTLGAIAALGTAAYGLVDATKIFGGGVSRAGFGDVRAALQPFVPALDEAVGKKWELIFFANWINGMAKDDQKAVAKSLIHLGLSPANADKLAIAGRVTPEALKSVVTKLDAGNDLDKDDINVLGRFDSMIDAALDGGFERADQRYRNASKALAALIAVLLAVAGGAIIASAADPAASLVDYLNSGRMWLAVLVGLVAVPLAPVAKDISSSLVAAVGAMKSV